MFPASLYSISIFPSPLFPGAGKAVAPETPGQAHPDPDETEWSPLILDASETSWTLI